jgi:phospholipid/cholesterol/gamma-HCH transport system substrate-binding protein
MRSRYVGVGIFVVVGGLLFATAVFLIGNQHNVFSKHIELFTEVKNLNGLSKGAKIRVAGFDAGEVAGISIPESPDAGFRLTLRITDQVRGLIRTDSAATIATEGVVGDKILLIGPGSSTASEAPPHATLPSKETSDMADLVQKSTALVTNASDTITVVADRLATTLDAVTTTVNNADDLVVGLKQGRGAVGMLLRDEQTAADIRTAIANARDATSSLNHASAQADALVSDFQSRGLGAKVDGMMGKADAIVSDLQSRNFGAKIDQTMESVNSAAHRIDITTQQLQATIGKALAPDARGRDAGDNIRETLSHVNDATANITEDTEALKHGFLFRGYFKKRGYYSMAQLAPDKYREDKVFVNPKNTRVWIKAAELFEPNQGDSEVLSPAGKARIDGAIVELGERVLSRAIVIEGYAVSEASGDDLTLSHSRASLIRNYLHARFQLETQNIGTVPLRGVPPPSTHKNSWNGICIVVLSQSS